MIRKVIRAPSEMTKRNLESGEKAESVRNPNPGCPRPSCVARLVNAPVSGSRSKSVTIAVRKETAAAFLPSGLTLTDRTPSNSFGSIKLPMCRSSPVAASLANVETAAVL